MYTPYPLHPAHYIPHHAPRTLHPATRTLHLAPCGLNPEAHTPKSLNPKPQTLGYARDCNANNLFYTAAGEVVHHAAKPNPKPLN